jgi:hypothetical protein
MMMQLDAFKSEIWTVLIILICSVKIKETNE